MILYKEKVAQYKEANNALEKEKEDLLDFKDSIPHQDTNGTLESLIKAMPSLRLKEGEIKTLKESLGEKRYSGYFFKRNCDREGHSYLNHSSI